MSSKIHPTAIIEEGAIIGDNCTIGPFCHIGPEVTLGSDNVLHSHVVIDGICTIGKGNTFYPFGVIGIAPQDLTYRGEPTRTLIGDNNLFREFASIHRGTMKEEGVTTIKNNCLIMAKVHVGHDAVIGNNCLLVNDVNLAGHVRLADNVRLGGATNVGQFIKIGKGAYIGGCSAIDKDIPPYCTALGNRIRMKGINIIGMKRLGIEKNIISETVDFFRMMESSVLSPASFIENEEFMKEYQNNFAIKEIVEFIKTSETGVAPFEA